MNKADLPPKPDPATGEPRPPRAPVEPGTKDMDKGKWDARKVPKAPEGRGPVLEWYVAPGKYQVYTAATFAVLGVAVFTLRSWSFDWVGIWWLWLVLAALTALGYVIPASHRMAAGADWFRGNRAWVTTYELVSIEVSGYAGGWNFDLEDRGGRKVSVTLAEIQASRKLWDLVYNGVRHSVAMGASTNVLARTKLSLSD